MNCLVSKNDRVLKGRITLPGSKSESNRALIMQALSKEPFGIHNLSAAADTVILKSIIDGMPDQNLLDVGPAGTAMRFLTAYCAVTPGEWTLTGSQRMKERPIGLLVDALRSLGAQINYAELDGYPPLHIKGTVLNEREVHIAGDVSSQYISALLMIAPTLPHGLTIHLKGNIGSRPYIEMTLSMMEELGITHLWQGNSIAIAAQEYQTNKLSIEPDWSGASYWYAMAAICDEVELEMDFLKKYSLQGDSAIAEIMANFGVKTTFNPKGIVLSKVAKKISSKFFDFTHCPDLAQTVISCCVAVKHDAEFIGLESLKIKETDRVAALQVELGKFGAVLSENEMGNKWSLDTSNVRQPSDTPLIHTYHDHRMAMALAPLSINLGPMEIENAAVTEKSYPSYWSDLIKLGFLVKDAVPQ